MIVCTWCDNEAKVRLMREVSGAELGALGVAKLEVKQYVRTAAPSCCSCVAKGLRLGFAVEDVITPSVGKQTQAAYFVRQYLSDAIGVRGEALSMEALAHRLGLSDGEERIGRDPEVSRLVAGLEAEHRRRTDNERKQRQRAA